MSVEPTICRYCGAENLPDRAICEACGTRIDNGTLEVVAFLTLFVGPLVWLVWLIVEMFSYFGSLDEWLRKRRRKTRRT